MSLLRHYSDVFRLLDETASRTATHHTNRRTFSPSFDVHETDQAYVLEGELPGLSDKSNLSIEFTDPQTLLVRGKTERVRHESSEKKDEKREEGSSDSTVAKREGGGEVVKDDKPRYWVSERTVGEFQRSFSFPSYVDVDAVKASLEHGILKIIVPKKQSQIARRIEIS